MASLAFSVFVSIKRKDLHSGFEKRKDMFSLKLLNVCVTLCLISNWSMKRYLHRKADIWPVFLSSSDHQFSLLIKNKSKKKKTPKTKNPIFCPYWITERVLNEILQFIELADSSVEAHINSYLVIVLLW